MPDLLVGAEGSLLISQDGIHPVLGLLWAFVSLWKVASVVQVCKPARKLKALLLNVVGILTL